MLYSGCNRSTPPCARGGARGGKQTPFAFLLVRSAPGVGPVRGVRVALGARSQGHAIAVSPGPAATGHAERAAHVLARLCAVAREPRLGPRGGRWHGYWGCLSHAGVASIGGDAADVQPPFQIDEPLQAPRRAPGVLDDIVIGRVADHEDAVVEFRAASSGVIEDSRLVVLERSTG